jgi:hypothetical protein
LPVAVFEGSVNRRFYFDAAEWGESEHRTAPHRWFVRCSSNDHVDCGWITDCAKRGNSSFANQRLVGISGQLNQAGQQRASIRFVLAGSPRSHLDNCLVRVAERWEQIDVVVQSSDFRGPATHGHIRIAEGTGQPVVGQECQPLKCTQRGGPNSVIVAEPSSLGSCGVASVSGNGDASTFGTVAVFGHCFKRSVRVVTRYAVPKAMMIAVTAPIMIANPELAKTAQTRRMTFGRL